MLTWKIIYGDGSTYSNADGSPESAPPWNIQIILERTEKEGVVRLSGKDYYWFDSDLNQWTAGEFTGVLDYMLRHTSIKIARSMRTVDFDALFIKHTKDPDFPNKSMRNYPREGPPTRGELP